MAWSLEIHHIGLARNGDATLIVARNDGAGVNQQVQVRSLLVDGGLLAASNSVNAYITGAAPAGAGLAALDVIAVTHYDADHFHGIRGLLRIGGEMGAPNAYDNCLIFDQGRPPGLYFEDSYLYYISAINLRGTRQRITRHVWFDNNPPIAGGWQNADWLLDREIFWTDNAGVATTPAALLAAPIGTNIGQPTVTCVAVNQYVSQADGNNPVAGLGFDPKNEKSLAFLVEFGNFKYYIGGDIETNQENFLGPVLNPGNNLIGRVHAVKLSHHGANTATSQGFVQRLRPKAAFISNGPNNQHGHPAQNTVNIIEGESVFNGTANGLEDYYLTGESQRVNAAVLNPNIAEVPGFPVGYVENKHIRIEVSQAQANNAPNGIGVNNFTVHWRDLGPLVLAVPVVANQRNH